VAQPVAQRRLVVFETPQDARPADRVRQLRLGQVHAYAREVALKPEEWMAGLNFLNATGQTSTERRPEFIPLSDTLGLSMMFVSLAQARPAAT
jgi:hydroxyquinol 1,2-dioxygenase